MRRYFIMFTSLLGVLLVSVGWCQELSLDVPPPLAEGAEDAEVDVLTRGPVHEAFAEQVSPNPQAGIVAPEAPPDPISELPPEVKPEGDDVVWIPGYWFWDEERGDYVWVSGVWRRMPPGRRWVPGYWQPTGGGYQWVAGFWSSATVSDVEYLESPPESLEAGPSSPASSDSDFWMPGHWYWVGGAYRWQSGSWCAYREGWTWVPARYVWTPHGCIFVRGYWDYALTRRGHLFAPVFFRTAIHRRPGYFFRPVCWIGFEPLLLHLFVRPDCHHLYFGDYYAPRYRSLRFTSFHSYHTRHPGFASLYIYYHHHFHRRGIDYCGRVRDWHRYYARHADRRPPHLFRGHGPHASRGYASELAHRYPSRGVERLGRERLEAVSPSLRRLQQRHVEELRDLSIQRRRHEVASKVRGGQRDGPAAMHGRASSRFRLPTSAAGDLAAKALTHRAGDIPSDILRMNRGERHRPVVRGQDAVAEQHGSLHRHRPSDSAGQRRGRSETVDGSPRHDRDRARQMLDERIRALTAGADAADWGKAAPKTRVRLPFASDAVRPDARRGTAPRPAETPKVRLGPGTDPRASARVRERFTARDPSSSGERPVSPDNGGARRSRTAVTGPSLPSSQGRQRRSPATPQALTPRTAPGGGASRAVTPPRVRTAPSVQPGRGSNLPRSLPTARRAGKRGSAEARGASGPPAASFRSAALQRGQLRGLTGRGFQASSGKTPPASVARFQVMDRAAVASTRRSTRGTGSSSGAGGKSGQAGRSAITRTLPSRAALTRGAASAGAARSGAARSGARRNPASAGERGKGARR